MNLIWIGLLIFASFLVLLFTLGVCRAAGMADETMDRLRASSYKGNVTIECNEVDPVVLDSGEELSPPHLTHSGAPS